VQSTSPSNPHSFAISPGGSHTFFAICLARRTTISQNGQKLWKNGLGSQQHLAVLKLIFILNKVMAA